MKTSANLVRFCLLTCLTWGVGASARAASPLAPGTVVVWGENAGTARQPPANLSNVVAIATGIRHCAALKSDGTVVAWGLYDINAGDPEALMPANLAGVVAIAAGKNHTLALKSDGTVAAWGYNKNGECTVPSGLTNVVAVSGGFGHSIALKADGTVIAWGLESHTNVPPNLNSVVRIAATTSGGLALKSDHSIIGFGADYTGFSTNLGPVLKLTAQFSWAALRPDGTVVVSPSAASVNIPLIESLKGIISVDYGSAHILLLTSAGNVLANGSANGGVLVIPAGLTNNVVAISNYERDCMALVGNPIVTQAPQIVQAPASQTNLAGTTAVFTVTASGTPPLSYQWRKNGLPLPGQTATNLAVPNLTVAAGGDYDVVVYGAGSVTSVPAHLTVLGPPLITSPGSGSGVAGVPFTYQITALGEPTGFQALGLPAGLSLAPATGLITGVPAGGGTFTNVALIATNAYGAGVKMLTLQITPIGTVVAWGNNTYQQTNVPVNLTNALKVTGGGFRSLALLNNGTVLEWGDSGTPMAPPGLTNVTDIAGGFLHFMARKQDGTFAVWGNNAFGETTPPAGLTNVVGISAGFQHSLAVRADGTVAAWGRNDFGQTNVPAGLTNVVAVAAAGYSSLALRTDGTVVGWGSGSPTNIPAGLSNVVAIAGGLSRGLALKADGTVASWGVVDQVGFPIAQPSGLSNVVRIAAGNSHCLALRQDGTVVTWGYGEGTNQPPLLNFAYEIGAGDYHSLAVVPITVNYSLPLITQPPQSQFVSAGGALTLFCGATNALAYQWFKDGLLIAGATNAAFSIVNVQPRDAGYYTVVVANLSGSVASSPALITVLGVPPAITAPPGSLVVSVGQPANFSVAATGTAPLAYQWRREGVDLVGETGATVGLVNVQTNQAGAYTVVITNTWGSITSSVAVLTVNRLSQTIAFGALPPKRVDEAPFSLTATASSGLPVSFSSSTPAVATVSGNTVTLTGAGSTVLTASQGGDATYLPAGSVSQTLVVSAPPSITTPPAGQSFTLGGGLTLTVNAGGTGPLFYQWQFNGTNLAGATGPTLTLTNLTVANAGAYRVVIANAVGTVTSVPVDLYFFGDLRFLAATVLAGAVGQQYRVDYAEVLAPGTTNWLVLTNLTLPSSPYLVIDPGSAGQPKRFYRAVPVP